MKRAMTVLVLVLAFPVSASASDLVVEIEPGPSPVITSLDGNPEETINVDIVGNFLWVQLTVDPVDDQDGTSSIELGPDVVRAVVTETGQVTLVTAPVEDEITPVPVVIDVDPEGPATFELPYFFRPLAMR